MSDPTPEEVLPCGTPQEDLLEQVADGRATDRDDHQRSCPHCAPRLDRYARVWDQIDRMRQQPVPLPPGFVDRVMERIDREANGDLRMRSTGRGRSSVRAGVVELLAAVAAEQVDGVVGVRSARLDLGTAAVRVEVDVRYGHPLREVGAAVRDAVLVHARAIVGPVLATVDVVVVGVLDREG